ncbi:MAG TPA: methyltransferase [Candidatus Binatia bacterium]|jgi:SAM-dependent methyltransferase
MPPRAWSFDRLRSEGSYWRSAILITAAHLDLFGWIGKQDKSPQAFATHFGGRSGAWEIFLDALCGLGLLRKHAGQYANSAFAARWLSRQNVCSLLPAHDDWNIWGKLDSALTLGKRPATQQPFVSDRSRSQRLLQSLDLDAQAIAPYLIESLPLSDSKTLLDVGGGLGSYAVAFCRHYPRLQATLVEHPCILPLARRAIAKAGMTKKVRIVGADLERDALPAGFDTVLVSNVLHAHGVRVNRSLLMKLQRCLNFGGQLIVRDVFMNQQRTAPEWGTLFSVLLFLQTPQGRCYTLDEIRAWLRRAGFSRIRGPFRSSPLPFDPDSILIAIKTNRNKDTNSD